MRLLVTGVDEASVDAAMRILPFRRSARVWFESNVDSAILTSSRSQIHDVTASQFFFKFACGFSALPSHSFLSLTGVGTSRFSCSGRRSKQGAAGIMYNTRTGGATWPNLVVEFGHSESMTLLRLDAQWWLTASSGLTRIAIFIKVADHPESPLHLETWRLQPNRQALRTGQAPSHLPNNTQKIDIDAAAVVTPADASRRIPYADVFDVGPSNAEDVVLSTAKLSRFA